MKEDEILSLIIPLSPNIMENSSILTAAVEPNEKTSFTDTSAGTGAGTDESKTENITELSEEELKYLEEKEFNAKLNEIIAESKLLLDNLYEECPISLAQELSRGERALYETPTLAYGEVTYESFTELFRLFYKHGLEKDEAFGMKFYDLGSGSGRLV